MTTDHYMDPHDLRVRLNGKRDPSVPLHDTPAILRHRPRGECVLTVQARDPVSGPEVRQ